MEWIADFVQVKIQKIDELGTGVVYLKILARMYPKDVSLSKMIQSPKNALDYTSNLRLLQKYFGKLRITRDVPIERLSQMRF